MSTTDATIVLADGSLFDGEAIGAQPEGGVTTGEFVFNTVLSGYQEVISDPSYAGQVITFTYAPHRQLRGQRDRRRGQQPALRGSRDPRARPSPQQLASRGGPRRLAASPRRRRDRRGRHPPPDPPPARPRCDPGRLRDRPVERLRAAALTAEATDGPEPGRRGQHRRPRTSSSPAQVRSVASWRSTSGSSRRSSPTWPASDRSRWCRRPRRSGDPGPRARRGVPVERAR